MTWRGRHIGARAVVGALFTALATAPQIARAGEVVLADGAMDAHVMSMRELRYARVVRQQFDFSCGSAAVATLLTFSYDRPVTERKVFIWMWNNGDRDKIQKVGFSLLDMQSYLQSIGLQADGFKVDFAKLREIGLPAITLITTGTYHHFVVVRGIRNDSLLLADSVLGMRRISKEEFTKIWSGVAFVITNETDLGQAHFNSANDWRLLPDAPVARGMDQLRLGLGGKFLNLPVGNEF